MTEINDDEMFSMSYKDAKDKYAVGVGNNKYFMSESDFNKGKERINKKNAEKQAASNKEEKPKKEQSLVANKFGTKKEKTWNDVKSEYNNDPAKIADYLNSATDYTPGNLTKKGMEEFGYSQSNDGKWAPKPKTETPTTETNAETSTTDTPSSTTDTTNYDYASEIEELKKENEEFRKQLDALQNPKTGKTDEEGAKSISDEHMKRGLEMGALTLDKDGNYVLTNVNKKGWEDWATIASAGLSVLGLAMGVPIIPINFRKITNKDKKDEAIREFQKQLTDISAGNLAKVKDVESSAAAGKLAKANEDGINAFSKYRGDFGDYEAKSNVDTSSEKELIETRTDAQIKADEKQFERDMKRIKSDRDFQIKFAALQQQYAEEMARLQSDLSTSSTIDIMKYQNSGFLKDLKDMGITPKELALYKASMSGISPADKNWGRVKIVGDILENAIKALK